MILKNLLLTFVLLATVSCSKIPIQIIPYERESTILKAMKVLDIQREEELLYREKLANKKAIKLSIKKEWLAKRKAKEAAIKEERLLKAQEKKNRSDYQKAIDSLDTKRQLEIKALLNHVAHPVIISFFTRNVTPFDLISRYHQFIQNDTNYVEVYGYKKGGWGKTGEVIEIKENTLEGFLDYIRITLDQRYTNIGDLLADHRGKVLNDYKLLFKIESKDESELLKERRNNVNPILLTPETK